MSAGGDIIGKTIAKCRILGPLGHGKTSTIFRAHYKPLGKEVAVKILKEDMKTSEEIRKKFVNEARAIAKLDHENIVKVYDVVEDRGYLCIIMELIPGRDLWQILERDGPFDGDRAVHVMEQAARALSAAHDQGIVHRDVKPQNLMLTGRRDKVKLVDFGLATKGAVVGKAGTPHYMSPEQIQGKKVDEKSDVYSLGATFFHLLAGRPPYPGKTREEILEKHLGGKLPTPSRARRDDPPPQALDGVVKRMMAPVPGYRYSAASLAEALEDLNLEAGSRAKRAHKARVKSKRSGVPLGLLLGVAGVAVIVIVLLVVFVFTGKKKPPVQPTGPRAQQPKDPEFQPLLNRSNAKAERENQARRLFLRAQTFENENLERHGEIIVQYQMVFDKFGDTEWGQKARAKVTKAEARRDKDKIAAVKAARERKARIAKEKLDRLTKKHFDAYDLAAARKDMSVYLLEHGEDPDLMETFNRLEYAVSLLALLAEAINVNPRKYELRLFTERAPEGALIESADVAKGLLVKEGTLENWRKWNTLKAWEIAKIAERQLGYNDPFRLYYLYNFLVVYGEKEIGDGWFQEAKSRDKSGRIEKMEKAVKKK